MKKLFLFLSAILLTQFAYAADSVTLKVVANTPTHYVIHMTNVSDATGESAVVKADKSTLLATDAAEPASLDIERVEWSVQGFTSVRLLWDHTTDDRAVVMSGTGSLDFVKSGSVLGFKGLPGLADPRSTGDTGDVLLTTAGTTSGNTYDILLWLRKQPD